MKRRILLRAISLVMVFSLLCVMVLSGCATKKKAPEDIISSAMTASVKNFEDKSSLDEIGNMLTTGLFSARMDITSADGTQTVNGYYADKQIVIDVGSGKKIGIDLGKLKEKFPKSIFGTEGDNIASITKEEEQQLIDTLGQIIDADELVDFSDNLADIIKENSTLKAEYGKNVDLAGGNVKVNVVDLSMTGSQLQTVVDKIASLFKDLLNTAGDDGIFDLGLSEEDKNRVMFSGSIYTDVKTDAFLGGRFEADPDGEEDSKTVFDIDVIRTDSTVEYTVKGTVDGEQHNVKLLISDLNTVETVSVTVDGESFFDLEINRGTKTVVFRAFDQQVLKFDYDIERAADNSIKSFSATFNFTNEGMNGGMIGSIFALPFFGASPAGMYGDDEPIGDYYFDDEDDHGENDYVDGWNEEPVQFKLTLSYAADGTLPEYKDILDFSMQEMNELLSEILPFIAS